MVKKITLRYRQCDFFEIEIFPYSAFRSSFHFCSVPSVPQQSCRLLLLPNIAAIITIIITGQIKGVITLNTPAAPGLMLAMNGNAKINNTGIPQHNTI
jgi:hypothetical protein